MRTSLLQHCHHISQSITTHNPTKKNCRISFLSTTRGTTLSIVSPLDASSIWKGQSIESDCLFFSILSLAFFFPRYKNWKSKIEMAVQNIQYLAQQGINQCPLSPQSKNENRSFSQEGSFLLKGSKREDQGMTNFLLLPVEA